MRAEAVESNRGLYGGVHGNFAEPGVPFPGWPSAQGRRPENNPKAEKAKTAQGRCGARGIGANPRGAEPLIACAALEMVRIVCASHHAYIVAASCHHAIPVAAAVTRLVE